MEMNVYAIKDNVVLPYIISINEKRLKTIRGEIDTWYGKGEVKETKTAYLLGDKSSSDKVEIISQRYAGKGELSLLRFPKIENVNLYKYKYYEYMQHPLSKLCDDILNANSSLDLSKYINELINWSTNNSEEMLFVGYILSIFTFKKLSVDEIVCSNLTVDEKKGALEKIKNALKKTTRQQSIFMAPKIYEEDVRKKIDFLQESRGNVYGDNIYRDKDYRLDENEERIVKLKILSTLPSVDKINRIM